MSLRLEMLQVARLSPTLLGESAELVRDFLLRQQNEDGGFRDRAGQSDLYYTVFALDGLLALQAEPPAEGTAGYLSGFGDGEALDFVHLCCLARAWAALARSNVPAASPRTEEWRRRLAARVGEYRASDGGFHPKRGAAAGNAYGCLLACGAYLDLGVELREPLRFAQCLKFLETGDGAWANERGLPDGSTNATAAAVTLLRHLALPINPDVGAWLLSRCRPEGGFVAMPRTPVPDLLSTATSLHALSALQCDLAPIRDPCLDFLDSLWTNEGGFHGHWNDEALDCEYTYYGLLALGHLAVAG